MSCLMFDDEAVAGLMPAKTIKKLSGTGTTNYAGEIITNLDATKVALVNMRVMYTTDLTHCIPCVSAGGMIMFAVLNRTTSAPITNASVSYDLYYVEME